MDGYDSEWADLAIEDDDESYDDEFLESYEDDEEDLDELLESLGISEDDDDAEFLIPLLGSKLFGKKRRPARRPPTARGRGYYRTPPSKQYVTQAQLRSALGKVSADVRRNATGIKSLNTRVNANLSRLNQQNAVNVRQNRRITALDRRIEQQTQSSLLMSLLEDDRADYEIRTVKLPAGATSAQQTQANALVGTSVELEKDSDMLSKLLPVLMTSSGGAGGKGPFGDPMMAVALAMAIK